MRSYVPRLCGACRDFFWGRGFFMGMGAFPGRDRYLCRILCRPFSGNSEFFAVRVEHFFAGVVPGQLWVVVMFVFLCVL